MCVYERGSYCLDLHEIWLLALLCGRLLQLYWPLLGVHLRRGDGERACGAGASREVPVPNDQPQMRKCGEGACCILTWVTSVSAAATDTHAFVALTPLPTKAAVAEFQGKTLTYQNHQKDRKLP